MSNLIDKMTEACQKNGFKIREIEEHIITICYQMHLVYISFNEKTPNDCVVTTDIKDISDDERMQVLECCNNINKRIKQYKYYILESDVVASIEFLFHNDEELVFQLENAVRSLSIAKTLYMRN